MGENSRSFSSSLVRIGPLSSGKRLIIPIWRKISFVQTLTSYKGLNSNLCLVSLSYSLILSFSLFHSLTGSLSFFSYLSLLLYPSLTHSLSLPSFLTISFFLVTHSFFDSFSLLFYSLSVFLLYGLPILFQSCFLLF